MRAQVEPAEEVAAVPAEPAEGRVDASKHAAASRKPKKIRRPMGAVRLPRGTPKPTGQRRDSSSRRQRYGHLAEEGDCPAAAECGPVAAHDAMEAGVEMASLVSDGSATRATATRPNSSSTPRSPYAYRPDVDGLRAVAVVAVLIYHMEHSWLPGGFVGVDVFFVISGFVVSGSLLKHFTPSHTLLVAFYIRRVRRLAPALFCVVLATAIAISTVVPPESDGLRSYYTSGQLALVGFANNHFATLASDYWAEGAETLEFNPFTHTWSLGVEEQFDSRALTQSLPLALQGTHYCALLPAVRTACSAQVLLPLPRARPPRIRANGLLSCLRCSNLRRRRGARAVRAARATLAVRAGGALRAVGAALHRTLGRALVDELSPGLLPPAVTLLAADGGRDAL